jgi:hypothetical protein
MKHKPGRRSNCQQGYPAIAFNGYPQLPELIERIKLFWQQSGWK